MPYNVTIDDISPIITYSSNWQDNFNSTSDLSTNRYWDRTFHTSQTSGDQALFQFNGTAVYVFGAKRANHGNYVVQLDDEQPEEYDGFGPTQPDGTDGVYQVPIYSRTNLANGLHRVVLRNKGDPNRPYLDIDFITWTSNEVALANKTLDDTRFQYTLADAWGTTSIYVGDYYGRTEQPERPHNLTNRGGAKASLDFNGTGIYLYGGTLDDHGAFTVQLDDHAPAVMNGSTRGYHARVLLYYADGLGPGTHTLSVINTDTSGKYLYIDYIDIIQPPPPSAVARYNTSMIAGIIVGILAALALIGAAAWYIMRRRKLRSKSYAVTHPVGYAYPGGAAGRNQASTSQQIQPCTNDSSTCSSTTRPQATISYRNNELSSTSLPDAHIHSMVPAPNLKARPFTAPNARIGQGPQPMGLISGHLQGDSVSQFSDTSDTETSGMLPPDYRQATQPFVRSGG